MVGEGATSLTPPSSEPDRTSVLSSFCTPADTGASGSGPFRRVFSCGRPVPRSVSWTLLVPSVDGDVTPKQGRVVPIPCLGTVRRRNRLPTAQGTRVEDSSTSGCRVPPVGRAGCRGPTSLCPSCPNPPFHPPVFVRGPRSPESVTGLWYRSGARGDSTYFVGGETPT